jgi:hypothetical protein
MGATVLSQQTGAHERQQLFDDLQVRFRVASSHHSAVSNRFMLSAT